MTLLCENGFISPSPLIAHGCPVMSVGSGRTNIKFIRPAIIETAHPKENILDYINLHDQQCAVSL